VVPARATEGQPWKPTGGGADRGRGAENVAPPSSDWLYRMPFTPVSRGLSPQATATLQPAAMDGTYEVKSSSCEINTGGVKVVPPSLVRT
jgi:hypothetical protein